MHHNLLRLSVFDQEVCIETDSVVYLDLLRKTYRHFLVDQPTKEGQVPFHVTFFSGKDNGSGRPKLMLNGQEIKLEEASFLRSEYVHAIILSSLYSNVSSHYLHHAAALSFSGRGILLTAGSGFGKTTLTLALVQRGFRFLSDEIAALGRKDALLYPFPRGLHIREKNLRLFELPNLEGKAHNWFGKYLIDIDDLFPGMIGEPISPSFVFVLKREAGTEPEPSNPHEFKAVLSHTKPAFLQQLQCHPEISGVQTGEVQGYPCLVIQAPQRMKVIPFFEDLCSQQGIMILDLVKREDRFPKFSTPAQFHMISRSQAALELLRRFVGGHKTALLSSAGHHDSTGLLFELASMLEKVACYEISVGPLQETVEVITNLVCGETPGDSTRMRGQKANEIL